MIQKRIVLIIIKQGGAGVRDNGIPYASFGLVWKKFGEQLCGEKTIADAIEQRLVLPIDGPDNGIDIVKSVYPGVLPYDLRDVMTSFKPTWKEDEENLYESFIFLVDVAKKIIKREIIFLKDKKEGEEVIKDIYAKTKDKRLLIIDK